MENTNKHYVDCGFWVENKLGKSYFGGETDNGECYKDLSAWINGNGIIYISEYQLLDICSGKVEETELWNRERWLEWVRDEVEFYLDDVNVSDSFIEYVAYDVLELADWQDLTTLLNEYDLVKSYNEWIENC